VPEEPSDRRITAFHVGAVPEMPIIPAPRWRAWMNETSQRFANRCLPLLMANQSGWALVHEHAVTATWSGGERPEDVDLAFDDPAAGARAHVRSHFGHGIVTWMIPYLFVTAPGTNLLARGPANWPLDGASPLEGLVETDWSFMGFTMNWKLTRPGLPVRFEAGLPFCVIAPERRGDLETYEPVIRPLTDEPELHAQYHRFKHSRNDLQINRFLAEFAANLDIDQREWHTDYFQGHRPDGSAAEGHQTVLRLRPFPDLPPDAV
jgi:hypothetical protein